MEFNGLTTTLTEFIRAFQSGYGHLKPAINGLLAALAAIDIVLFGFWMALGGTDNLSAVIKKILFLGFWIWFTREFQENAGYFMHSLVKAGLTAGGGAGGEAILLDPSRIAGMGLQATAPLAEALQGISFDIGDKIVFGLSLVVIMLTFVLMAIQVFLAVLEYYLLVTVVAILVPFGVFAPTKFLAEKAIGAVVGSGIKLMVLALLMAILGPLLSQVHFAGAEIKLNELWVVLGTCLCYAYLVWHVPGTIAGALAGSPSLSAASVAQNASGALMGAAGVAGLGIAATRMAAGAASSVAGAGARAIGTAAGGWSAASSGGDKAGSPASLGSKALGAGRAVGQAALGAIGGLARRAASPVVDGFRAGATEAFNRNLGAAPSPPSASPGSASSPPPSAAAPAPSWAAAAQTALRSPTRRGKRATPDN